jgi:predicted dithiol-disulfide oxidoreductase (DUF899 family)
VGGAHLLASTLGHSSAATTECSCTRGRTTLRTVRSCYVRDADRVFETYWTTIRGVEAMDYSYALTVLTVSGHQETWEDSAPAGHNRATR